MNDQQIFTMGKTVVVRTRSWFEQNGDTGGLLEVDLGENFSFVQIYLGPDMRADSAAAHQEELIEVVSGTGTWRYIYNGDNEGWTGALAHNISAEDLETAINTIPGVNATCTVTGTPGVSYEISWVDDTSETKSSPNVATLSGDVEVLVTIIEPCEDAYQNNEHASGLLMLDVDGWGDVEFAPEDGIYICGTATLMTQGDVKTLRSPSPGSTRVSLGISPGMDCWFAVSGMNA